MDYQHDLFKERYHPINRPPWIVFGDNGLSFIFIQSPGFDGYGRTVGCQLDIDWITTVKRLENYSLI